MCTFLFLYNALMNSTDVLITIIKLFSYYLDELNDTPKNDFILGEMTAFVECLEIIKEWEHAKNYGLNFVIDKKYKI